MYQDSTLKRLKKSIQNPFIKWVIKIIFSCAFLIGSIYLIILFNDWLQLFKQENPIRGFVIHLIILIILADRIIIVADRIVRIFKH